MFHNILSFLEGAWLSPKLYCRENAVDVPGAHVKPSTAEIGLQRRCKRVCCQQCPLGIRSVLFHTAPGGMEITTELFAG